MSATTATLDGFSLLNAAAVRWPQVDGAAPVKQVFFMEAGTAQALMKKRKGGIGDSVTLSVQVGGLPLWQAEKLYVLGLVPGPTPQILGVLVADQREWWPNVTVALACNVPRRVGQNALLQEGVPVELTQFPDNLQYAPWSLLPPNNAKAFQAIDMLKSVLTTVTVALGTKFTIEKGVSKRQMAVQGVQFVEPGNVAIQRALNYLAGVAVTILLNGTVYVRDARDGSEAALATAGAPIVGAPLPLLADHRLVRPSSITVYYEREIELRLDSIDEETGKTVSTGDGGNAVNDYRGMENVGQVTDPSLKIEALNGVPSATVPRGTWLDFVRLTKAWQANPVAFQQGGPSGWSLDLSIQSLQQWYCSPGILTTFLQGGPAGLEASWLLGARIDSAFSHFRTTYRLPSKYLDRISRIYPYRSGLLDPATGTRAPASVYCDFARFLTVRGALSAAGNADSFRFLWQNFKGYNASLASATQAPFSVTVPDEQQGIIRIAPAPDPFGRVSRTIPGKVVGPDGTNPCSADPRDAGPGRPGIQEAFASLQAGFTCTVVLTVVPAAPNNVSRFESYEISPDQAESVLGIKLGPCLGPPLSIRIPPSVAVSRIPWFDESARAVDQAMGVPGAGFVAVGGVPGLPDPLNDSQLQDVAVAVAAQIWAHDVDRWEGGITLPLSSSLQPTGNAGAISHALQPDGTAVTIVAFPPQPPPLDMLSMLSEEARRVTLGLIEQRGASGS